MKKFAWLCAVVLWNAGCPSPEDAPDRVERLSARMELAAGEVWLDADAPQRLITGAMLPGDARVQVKDGGRALIRLCNGAGMFLRENTAVHIGPESVALAKGEIWADVPDDEEELATFTVGKVTVTASGAGLDIRAAGDRVEVYVARGLAVVASDGGRVEVSNGEMAVVKGAKRPSRSPVSFFDDWTGGMADRPLSAGQGGRASGRIYGIDRTRPGSAPLELQIASQSVTAVIREGVAYTTVDQSFFNTAAVDVEGWYWFTIPENAAVVRFAWEMNGQLVDGTVIERGQAAAAYEDAVQRAVDPALLEWVDARTFRARIYPVPRTGTRRIVLAYAQLLPLTDGVYRYVYPLAGDEPVQIQEFSLRVALGEDGEDFSIAASADAVVEKDHSAVSMRRSGFVPRSDFMLELRPEKNDEPLRAMRYSSGGGEADYILLRYSPQVEWQSKDGIPGDVVVVMDTSAGGDVADHAVRVQTVEALLRSLSAEDTFAVIATDLTPRRVFPAEGMAKAAPENVAAAVDAMADLTPAGATDLGSMFSEALELVHDAPQPAVVYVGDGNATVGETGSDALAERLRRALGASRARLFTIAVGDAADRSLLARLATMGGGAMFRIDLPEQAVQESLRFSGMLKTPTITDLHIDAGAGLDLAFSTATGKVSQGDEVVLLARTHHKLPGEVTVTGTLGGQTFKAVHDVDERSGNDCAFVPSLWAGAYLSSLMGRGAQENRGRIVSLGISYQMMTPYTSFLVLEQPVPSPLPAHVLPFRYWSEKNRETRHQLADLGGIPFGLAGCTAGDQMEVPPGEEHSVSPSKMPQEAPAAQASASGGATGMPSMDMAPSPVATAAPAEPPSVVVKEEMAKSAMRRAPADALLGARMKDEGGEAEEGGAIAVNRKNEIAASAVCSDGATRSLRERRILWMQRLDAVNDGGGYRRIYDEAEARCELPGFRDRKVLLDLIAERAQTAEEVQLLLAAFAGRADALSMLRRRIVRRALDPDLLLWLGGQDGVNWAGVKSGLAAMKTAAARLDEVRRLVAQHPDSAMGRELLVEVLLENGLLDEAAREAGRLQRDGLASPQVIVMLCDLQALAGQEAQARRTCSELVEFNPDDPAARRQLGDLFLRHGWYADAYRQYTTLVDIAPDDPAAQLRLAMAAAGMGKVDEALRIERRLASSDGESGPDDPRRFATLMSAARLAMMIEGAQASADGKLRAALEQQLKRTGLFGGPVTWRIVVWEDLAAPLSVSALLDGQPFVPREILLAGTVGLIALDLGERAPEGLLFDVVMGMSLRREVPFRIIDIAYDGKKFSCGISTSRISTDALTVAVN